MKTPHQKLVCGFGINNSLSPVQPMVNGKRAVDPCYQVWHNMLKRCYSHVYQARQPTYIGCTVTEEWRYLTVFREWMLLQEHEGKHLDKDIISPGNKHYSPDLCCFVSRQLNTLLVDAAAARGEWPKGVCFHKRDGKFGASLTKQNKQLHLGYFDTPEDASGAYNAAKSAHITEIANQQTDPRISLGLLAHAGMMI